MKKIFLLFVVGIVFTSACKNRSVSLPKHIVVVSCTNREGNMSSRVAEAVIQVYKEQSMEVESYDLIDLPLETFSPQGYQQHTPELDRLNAALLAADGIVFVFPEYNAGMPGVLKYVIDLLKFPETFKGKHYALVSVSAGQYGAARAYQQLAENLKNLGALVCGVSVKIASVYEALPDFKSLDKRYTQDIAKQATAFIAHLS